MVHHIAVTDRSKGNNGMTAFIVHKDAPGFSVGKHEKKMGIRGSATCELILKNVRVNKNDILGKRRTGVKDGVGQPGFRTYGYRYTGTRYRTGSA